LFENQGQYYDNNNINDYPSNFNINDYLNKNSNFYYINNNYNIIDKNKTEINSQKKAEESGNIFGLQKIEIGNIEALKNFGSTLNSEFERIKNKYNLNCNNNNQTPYTPAYKDSITLKQNKDNIANDNISYYENTIQTVRIKLPDHMSKSQVKKINSFDKNFNENMLNLNSDVNDKTDDFNRNNSSDQIYETKNSEKFGIKYNSNNEKLNEFGLNLFDIPLSEEVEIEPDEIKIELKGN